jgi:ParB family transcriptional regulator, chromosome partitioning protein
MSVSTLAPIEQQSTGAAMTGEEPADPTSAPPLGAVEEYDRIVWVPPSSLRIGPNVRQEDAEPDKEQVRAFKKDGVQDPIKAYRNEIDQLVVIVGQLRTKGAVTAGVERVPVWVVAPPTGDEKAQLVERIVTQFGENRHRKAMTRGDEFRAFEQLELAGMSPTAIGRALCVAKPEVAAALAVGHSHLAAKAADAYDLTLDQAAVIAEFEAGGDVDTAQRLITAAVEQPHNFDTIAQRARNDRAEAQQREVLIAELTEQLTAAGVAILDDSVSDWSGPARSLDRLRPTADAEPGTDFTPEEHAGCPGHSAWIDVEYDEDDREVPVAVYGCADFVAHGHALSYGSPSRPGQGPVPTAGSGDSGISADSDDEAAALAAQVAAAELARRKASIERRWVRENNKDADATLPKRRQWLAGLARRTSLPKGTRQWLALRTFEASALMHKAMERGHPLAHELLDLPQPSRSWSGWTGATGEDLGELHRRIATAADTKAAVYELYLTLCAMEEAFDRDAWRNPTSLDKVYIAMAIELGYEAPDVDRKVLHPDNLDQIVATELGLDGTDTDDADLAEVVAFDAGDADPDPVDADLAA